MEEAKENPDEQKRLLFTGFSGDGITSILNAYAGKVIFDTDLSFDGTGCTKKLQTFDNHGILLMNTPGISNTTINYIEEGLNYPGNFIINFVISPGYYMLSIDETLLINSIILSISSSHCDGNFTYGFIINGLSKFQYKSGLVQLKYILNNIFNIPPSYILLVPQDDNADEGTNVLLSSEICDMVKTTIDKCEYVSIVTSHINLKTSTTLMLEKIAKVKAGL